MKKILTRILITCLLATAVVFAVFQQQQSHYATIKIEATHASAGTVLLDFLFDGRATLADCERLTGNIARTALKKCPECLIRKLACETTLDEAQRNLLSDSPITSPSGRMANGVIVFQSPSAELAQATCRITEAQSAKNPVKCHLPDTPRPKPPKPSPANAWSLALLLAAFVSAWLVGWLIIRYEHLHAHLSHDHVGSGPQKYHTQPTPRIGGLAVLAGLLTAGGFMLYADALHDERSYGLLLLAAMPAFLGGLIEDVTKKVGVYERLFLTMLSGAIAAWLLGAVIDRIDIPGVDLALAWLPFAVVFTAFAVGGIANAINIIDGYNGLAGGFAVIVLTAIAFVANQVGDGLVFAASLALAGAVLGFLVWNWPDGKVFLGDGGAYLLGFMLAELSVLIVVRNPDVSPWFPLLLLIYPIFETLYSIYRRKLKSKHSPSHPDNKHLHQLIHDTLVQRHVRGKRLSRNSQVAKYLWFPTTVLAWAASQFPGSTPILASFAVAYCVLYIANYRHIAKARTRAVHGLP